MFLLFVNTPCVFLWYSALYPLMVTILFDIIYSLFEKLFNLITFLCQFPVLAQKYLLQAFNVRSIHSIYNMNPLHYHDMIIEKMSILSCC